MKTKRIQAFPCASCIPHSNHKWCLPYGGVYVCPGIPEEVQRRSLTVNACALNFCHAAHQWWSNSRWSGSPFSCPGIEPPVTAKAIKDLLETWTKMLHDSERIGGHFLEGQAKGLRICIADLEVALCRAAVNERLERINEFDSKA